VRKLNNVLVKLARGHASYELSEPLLDPSSAVRFAFMSELSPAAKNRFESPPALSVVPEVGSRGMIRGLAEGADWLCVQPNRYGCMVSAAGDVNVRLVLSELMVAEVIWAA
jgi:hypothetical protein